MGSGTSSTFRYQSSKYSSRTSESGSYSEEYVDPATSANTRKKRRQQRILNAMLIAEAHLSNVLQVQVYPLYFLLKLNVRRRNCAAILYVFCEMKRLVATMHFVQYNFGWTHKITQNWEKELFDQYIQRICIRITLKIQVCGLLCPRIRLWRYANHFWKVACTVYQIWH